MSISARRRTEYGSRPRSNPSGRRTKIRIRNQADASASTAILKHSVLGKQKASTPNKAISQAKIAGYMGSFLIFVGIIAIGYQTPSPAAKQVNRVSVATLVVTDDSAETQTPSVDEIVATDVAASLTGSANLPIASSIANMSASLAAKNDIAQSDEAVISKPQILQPDDANRNIRYYKAKRGESVGDVASRYNLSANTVRWANNLDSDALRTGQKLKILPTDGIQHTVQSGETIEQLARRYKTDVARITAYNDLELSKPKNGQKLIIPSGILPTTERPGYEAPVSPWSTDSGSSNSSVISSNLMASAGNRYAPGNCTWYAYERGQELGRPIGSFWGNANTWDDNARAAGLSVNNTPKPGAVFVNNAGYYGHVAIVERVDSKGNVHLSEMNYAGFNVVSTRTISAGQAASYTYIH